jgi:hypothetical protein
MVLALGAIAVGCKSRAAPPAPAPSATAARPSDVCAADEDCAPLNCCFAVAEDSCIVKSRSNCDKNKGVSVECGPEVGPRFTCACKEGACVGKPVWDGGATASSPSGGAASPSVAAGATSAVANESHWVTGGLDEPTVLKVIMAHASDVKACHALGKKSSGVLTLVWDVAPAGNVTKSLLGVVTVPSEPMRKCMLAKVKQWRFPSRKTESHVTYTFQFAAR